MMEKCLCSVTSDAEILKRGYAFQGADNIDSLREDPGEGAQVRVPTECASRRTRAHIVIWDTILNSMGTQL